MSLTGKLEVTIKINSVPDAETVENGWQQFALDCDGRLVTIKVKPKTWKKLTQAQEQYPMWVAAITGKIGTLTPKGFSLEQPSIQVFEKKPKEAKLEKPPV